MNTNELVEVIEMTELVWTDQKGLTLRKTAFDEQYFLDVAENVRGAIRPFLELSEMKAVLQPKESDTKASDLPLPLDKPEPFEEKGWLLPADMFEKLKPFLTHFHDVLPPADDKKRDLYTAGLETPSVITREGRANVFQLSFQEMRLLALLFAATHELSPHVDTKGGGFIEQLLEGLSLMDDVENDGTLDRIDALLREDPAFNDLRSRYAAARFAGQVKHGDLVQLAYDPYSKDKEEDGYEFAELTAIYDGESGQFQRLIYSDDTWRLPKQFQVPSPFPIMWWDGLYASHYSVQLNFDKFLKEMKFAQIPVIGGKLDLPARVQKKVIDEFDKEAMASASVLSFAHERHGYSIFFVSPLRSPISHETVMELTQQPETDFEVPHERTIVAFVV